MKHPGSVVALLLIFLFAFPRPGNDNNKVEIATESGNTYILDEIEAGPGSGSLYENNLYIFTATADELRDAAAPESPIYVNIPRYAKDAASIGASLLDKTFVHWSEAGSVCVYLNETANAWVVFGQMKDRNSTAGSGTIAIEADTGEVMYLSFGFPST